MEIATISVTQVVASAEAAPAPQNHADSDVPDAKKGKSDLLKPDTASSSRVSTALPSSRGSAMKTLRPETASTAGSASPRMSARGSRRALTSMGLHRRTTARSRFGDIAQISGPPRRGAVVADLLGKVKKPLQEEEPKEKKKASEQWQTVRKAVHATRFWKRMALMSARQGKEQKLDLGSMKQFLDGRKLKDINWTDDSAELLKEAMSKVRAEDERNAEAAQAAGGEADAQKSPPPPPASKPLNLQARRRREVPLIGKKLSLARSACPRHQQLSAMLPRLKGETSSLPSPPQRRPITAPSALPQAKSSADPSSATSFTLSLLTSGISKPRAEFHPLLSAIEGMQEEDVFSRNPEPEQAVLAHRLDELRWSEQRRGPWTAQPERRKPLLEDPALLSSQARQERRRLHDSPKHPMGGSPAMQADMELLLHLMDPDNTGMVSPDVFVPLMFWLGLTRRRGASLTTMELAFGPGDIEASALRKLTAYLEVQMRLVEGLRRLARLESLEQLCEFITDWHRLRTWFYTMKRDTTGHVDIVEVQNLFARMEVTSDRQALFRFLSYTAKNEHEPPEKAKQSGSADTTAGLQNRTFGIADFASLLCRCAVAWCLHRTLVLINPDLGGSRTDGTGPFHVPLGVPDSDREAQLRWTQLQRKIIVSLLVNHRFWGRESRTVLASLNQPAMTTLGTPLTPEQWLSLFQRVRAQGIASTLPTGEETEDPDFLIKKARRHGGGKTEDD